MANRIQLRRDTAANWTRVNPVLEDGEPGLEIDTNYIKYGDGNTPWADLEYASTGGSSNTLVNGAYTVSLGADGALTFPGNTMSMGNNMFDYLASTGVLEIDGSGGVLVNSAPDSGNLSQINLDGYGNINIRSITSNGSEKIWDFGYDGNLTTPGNVQIGNVATYGNISYVNTIRANNYAYANGVSILSGISGSTGSITFDGIKMIGANIGGGSAEIELVPDNTGSFYANGQYVRIYPTRAVPDSPHIHIDSGSAGDLILGNDQRGVDVNHDANVYIRTDQYAGAYNWQFGSNGNLTLPNGSSIDAMEDGYGIGLTTDRGTILFGNRPEIGQPNHFHIMKANVAAVDLFFGDDSDYVRLPGTGNVEIGAGGSAWTFGSNSNLSLPYGVGVIGSIETTDSVDLYGDINTQYVQLNYNNQNFVYVDTSGAHMQAGPTAPGEYEIWLSVDGSTTFPDHKPVSITGNLTVGNLIVNGNTTTINTTSYSVSDNIIQMAVDNPADTLDIGFVGHRTVNSSLQHTGLIRDASTGLWKLFSNVAAQPGTTVDFSGVVYDDLQLDKLFADTIHLTGTPPGTRYGSAGDLAGDVHIDGDFLYYCTANYVDQHYSAMSNTAYTMDNVWHIDKGSYPDPQVGWTITGTSYPGTEGYTTTITSVVDEGSTWGITGAGIGNNGVIAAQAVTFSNPTYPSIWRTIPLSAFGTEEYTNTNVNTFLLTYTGSLGNLRVLNTFTPVTAGGNVGDMHGQVRIDSDYMHVTTGAYGQQSYVVTAFANHVFGSQYFIALAKGGYPKPESGWEITRDGWGQYHTIDAEPVDYGDYWWCSISSYSTSYPAWSEGDNVVLRGTTSTVWKSIPLNTFKTATTGTYSDTNVAAYLTGNITAGNVTATQYNFANGVNILSTVSGSGSSYANADAAAYLAANSAIYLGNPVARYPLQANVTQTFVGNTTTLTSGAGASLGASYLLNNIYFGANGAGYYRNTQTGAAQLTIGGANGFSFAGTTGSVTANAVQGMGSWATINSSGIVTNNSLGISAAGALTALGGLVLNTLATITTNQTTAAVFNATATTISMGNAASTIYLGSSSVGGTGSNVFVGNAIGTSTGNLTVRARGTWNLLTINSAQGGYNTPPYTNQTLTGGSGTGMTATYSATGGYVTTITIVSIGSGYRNGDVLTLPGGLGTTVVLSNYDASKTGIGQADYMFGIDGNLSIPGNVSITGNVSLTNANISGVSSIVGSSANTTITANAYVTSFLSNGVMTTANVIASGNVTAAYYAGSGSQLTGVATKVSGSWTLAAGANTVSLTVPGPGTYALWVNGNIPNGICTYTATVVVTNNNVPVLGSQYAWYYAAGNMLVITSIPGQIVGTANSIITTTASTTTANVFDFGITNNSGASCTVEYGYTKLS